MTDKSAGCDLEIHLLVDNSLEKDLSRFLNRLKTNPYIQLELFDVTQKKEQLLDVSQNPHSFIICDSAHQSYFKEIPIKNGVMIHRDLLTSKTLILGWKNFGLSFILEESGCIELVSLVSQCVYRNIISVKEFSQLQLIAQENLWLWNQDKQEFIFSTPLDTIYSSFDVPWDEFIQKIHPDDRYRFNTHWKHLQDTPDFLFNHNYRFLNQDGIYCWYHLQAKSVYENNNGFSIVGSFLDITEKKDLENQVIQSAYYDPLTGLPNRALFVDRLSRSLARSRRRKDFTFAVLFLDLDRFKVINDTLGQKLGDQFIIEVSKRLEQGLRNADTLARLNKDFVARLGGDEFSVLLDDVKNIKGATRVARRIKDILKQPITIDQQNVYTSVSVGIVISSSNYENAEEILRDADVTMYRAKSKGKDRYEIFDDKIHAYAINQLKLESDLRAALDQNQLTLAYQPIVNLASMEVDSFEALLRWPHPERGMVSPMEFIPIAEETGMIVPMGFWVLEEVCRKIKSFEKKFKNNPVKFSVNISAKQFVVVDFVSQIKAILKKHDVSHQRINFEITESVIMDNIDTAHDIFWELKKSGLELHMDDFGTGFSSLSYLHKYPMDVLKVDRSFVGTMNEDDDNYEIVKSIVNLAHNLKMKVVAEGVETVEQLNMLKALCCDYAQGYYFAKPMDGISLIEWMTQMNAFPDLIRS